MRQKLKSIFPLSHPQHIILGLALIGVGLILICNDYYYFWPPQVAWVLNDDLCGGLGVVFGVMTIRWALKDSNSIRVNRNLLFFSAFFWCFEATAEFIHASVKPNAYMLTAGVAELGLFLFTLSIIDKSKKHNY